ncbi:unnamed protein product [Pipistrellus nathusii]|uniref:Leucine-rich repeat-containing protein 37 N-terminal domain-containing protein n=1 Tax=Pipistrellus nathusii TaxID=59473 RepID=A0ABP0A8I8_PIPNA
MSGLHLWASRLLFTWQLMWLQVQAAHPLALAPVLLTSVSPGPIEPRSWDQQNPICISEDDELPSSRQEVSALPPESSETREASPNSQKASAQLPPQHEAQTQSAVSSELLKALLVHQGVPSSPECVQSSIQQKSSPPSHVCLAGVQPSPGQQKGRAQPRKSSMDVVAQPSVHREATVSPLGSGEAQHPVLPIINVEGVDLGVLITSEPPTNIELSAADKVSAHPPKFIDKLKPPSQQETTAQPSSATALQQTTAPPKSPEVALPHPEPVQAQQPTLFEVTFQPPEQELTITPKPTLEADGAALQQTTAPPKPSEVAPPEPIQAQQPMLTEVTVQSVDPEVIRTQQRESFETVPPVTERSATMNVCKLCTCSNGTLSCTGLGPKQRLHRVPVPEPHTYSGTFTVLNLQGNSISYIGKDTWKSYHLVEKLILSGNNLRELRKDSFEGLHSLQYLDLSCNKIGFIERNTFGSLPFLQHLNLSHNLITKLSFGMFQAQQGMQILHKSRLMESKEQNKLTNDIEPEAWVHGTD